MARVLVLAVLAALAAAAPAAARDLVVYERTAGRAGIVETVRVGTGGLVRVREAGDAETRRSRLGEDRLRRLRRTVRRARFASLEPFYAGSPRVADAPSERVRRGDRLVVVQDGAEPPARLRRLLRRIRVLAG